MFEVNWCIVGQEPESLPFYFDSWDRAYDFVKLELSHLKYAFEDDAEIQHEISSVLVQLYDKINITDGKDVTFTVGNISYWLLDLGQNFGDSLSVEQRYKL